MSEWRYGVRAVGPCETRHEAIGEALVAGRGDGLNLRWDRSVHAIREENLCPAVAGFERCTPPSLRDSGPCRWCGEKIDR